MLLRELRASRRCGFRGRLLLPLLLPETCQLSVVSCQSSMKTLALNSVMHDTLITSFYEIVKKRCYIIPNEYNA